MLQKKTEMYPECYNDSSEMSLTLIDTHCHLDIEPLSSSVEPVLERARAAGVVGCLTIGTSLEASRANVALARRYPMLRAAIGVHPNEADTITDEMLQTIEAMAGEPCVAAIGEVGLDEYRQDASPANQQRALRAFIGIAGRRRLPLAIHCRNAYEPLLRILRESCSPLTGGVIHCASGPPEFIQEAVALGFHVSFAGNVTFPKAHDLRQLVLLVPDDRLLVETDAPFLAPQPVRGKPNEPAYVAHTAQAVAQLRGVSLEALGALTTANAKRLFRFPN